MDEVNYRALVVEERDGAYVSALQTRSTADLSAGEVLVRVSHSSLNYKDALSAAGNRGVTKHYPHTPGIDAAGVVAHSDSPRFAPGQSVLVTGFDLGMNTSGGLGEYCRVPADWVLPQPTGLSAEEAMAWGTAGLTAGLALERIQAQVDPSSGPVLVSGATGGVGILAISLLHHLGYEVHGLTGKATQAEWLGSNGAARVLPRSDFETVQDRPLLKGIYRAVIDTVGGPILVNAIKSLMPGGIAVACGNAASPSLDLTVFPFILRGVTLAGIDSQNCPLDRRTAIWTNLAGAWKPALRPGLWTSIPLADVPESLAAMQRGESRGRVVVRV